MNLIKKFYNWILGIKEPPPPLWEERFKNKPGQLPVDTPQYPRSNIKSINALEETNKARREHWVEANRQAAERKRIQKIRDEEEAEEEERKRRNRQHTSWDSGDSNAGFIYESGLPDSDPAPDTHKTHFGGGGFGGAGHGGSWDSNDHNSNNDHNTSYDSGSSDSGSSDGGGGDGGD